MCKQIILLALLALLAVPVFAQVKQPASDRRVVYVDADCKKIGDIPNLSSKFRIFANVAGDQGQLWREFSNESSRQNADADDRLNESAYVWTEGGRVIAANFTLQSESRDWVQYVLYCFRADGRLAKIDAQLNTFYGHMTVKRQIYFDESGRVLKRVVEYMDLKSKKRKKPGTDFIDEQIPVYLKDADLPFYHMLSKVWCGLLTQFTTTPPPASSDNEYCGQPRQYPKVCPTSYLVSSTLFGVRCKRFLTCRFEGPAFAQTFDFEICPGVNSSAAGVVHHLFAACVGGW